MNIRVDLNYPIKDGTEVVFRSPVDCSQVTGLKVYYPGEDGNTVSKEFAFADAHGNNVGYTDHLFAENVAVKVILDVTTGMAFVQNADTNAYLEGRFEGLANQITGLTDTDFPNGDPGIKAGYYAVKDGSYGFYIMSGGRIQAPDGNAVDVAQLYGDRGEGDVLLTGIYPGRYYNEAVNKGQLDAAVKDIIDKTCPAFTQSGAIVTCEPVEGYPLTVITDEGATKVTQYGKNLLSFNDAGKTASGVTFTANSDGSITVNGTATADVFYDVGKAQVKAGQTYTLNGGAEGGGGVRYAIYVAHEDAYYYDFGKGVTFTAVANKNNTFRIMVKKGITANNLVFKPMLRMASVADASYTPYQAPLTYAPGDTIPALPGVNTIWADAGEITVTGRANPATIIEKLTNAVLSMGGNV